MKWLLSFSLVAVWVKVSAGVACEDVTTCTPDISRMQADSAEDLARLCKSVQDAIQCFRDAMQDCRHHGSIPEETIKTLERQIDSYDNMLGQHCSGSGTSDGNRGGQSPYNQGVSVKSSFLVTVILTLLAVGIL